MKYYAKILNFTKYGAIKIFSSFAFLKLLIFNDLSYQLKLKSTQWKRHPGWYGKSYINESLNLKLKKSEEMDDIENLSNL